MIQPFPGVRPALAAAGLLAALIAAPAAAQNADQVLCSQPVEPTCVGSEITYENEQRIKRCERDLERFADQVDEYVSCLKQKSKLQQQATDELRKRFECRAAGNEDC